MAVPSARTFEDLKDSITRYLKLKDDAEADTLAGLAIRSALVRLSAYPLKSMLAEAELTLTTAFHTVTLPTDFNMSMSLFLLDTSNRRAGRIYFKREEDFDYIVPDDEAVSGDPELYTVRGEKSVLELDRTPTAAFVAANPKVRLRYFKRLDQLVTGTSTFVIAPEVEEFIVWHGRSQLAPLFDAKMYPLAAQEANRALMDLKRRNTIQDEQDWV